MKDDLLHIPVLLKDVVRLLSPQPGEAYLDLTAGYGGHASKIIDVVGAPAATLVDRDARAIATLDGYGQQGATLIRRDFATAAQQLADSGQQFDMVLVDLGVSSPQLDMAERGFSIKRDGPLDMRMDESSTRTAADIVNRTSEKELARIIETYGQEPRAMAVRIAHAIRLNRPLLTTTQLADVILNTHRGSYQKIHPATRTFQAIRIALNDELSQIEELMPLIPHLLKPGGRVVVISFHSLEDRIVKRYFADQTTSGYEASMKLLIKKPILGADIPPLHHDHNPRARSAILRAAVKI
ncbi:MAG: 16S rRNA (cytosine(1402)-N(4))-methyltransferase RsmH [Candidatus Saccharimonadales bacterium]